MIRHFVALRFRSDVPASKKSELYESLKDLSTRISGILAFHSFKNVSVELPMVRNFNDGFWFDFRDATVRDAYLVDAAHQAIGSRIVAELEGGADGVFVFDVEL
jgi:Stress responsive A/B Barrel Domain